MCKIKEEIVYYQDESKDDFAGTEIKQVKLPNDFKYVSKNIFFRFFGFLVYYALALPILWIIVKFQRGVKVKNKKVLKKIKKQGYFIYANHTYILDCCISQNFINPKKRGYLIVNPDAVSIKGIKSLVMMMGAIPIPTSLQGMKHFMDAVGTRIKQKHKVTIYPEAHIWPYYTGIRPFPVSSFRFPVMSKAPSIAAVSTYRKTHWPFKKARITVYLSEPFYVDESLGINEAANKLRDEIYSFMKKTSESVYNKSHIQYIKKEKEKIV